MWKCVCSAMQYMSNFISLLRQCTMQEIGYISFISEYCICSNYMDVHIYNMIRVQNDKDNSLDRKLCISNKAECRDVKSHYLSIDGGINGLINLSHLM